MKNNKKSAKTIAVLMKQFSSDPTDDVFQIITINKPCGWMLLALNNVSVR